MTAMRLSAARCIGLFCLLAIALMASGGDTPPTDSPARESTSTPANAFTSISAGGAHTCWLRTDDLVECWGSNEHGESNPPDGSLASISAGAHHTCGVMTDGSVKCWGSNKNLIGDVMGQAMPPDGSFISVSSGAAHTCGLKTDGSVECWGSNEDFHGNEGGQATPPGSSFVLVSAGVPYLRHEDRRRRRMLGLQRDLGRQLCWSGHSALIPGVARRVRLAL